MRILSFTSLAFAMLTACSITSQRQSSVCDVATAFTEMVATDMLERPVVFSDQPLDLTQHIGRSVFNPSDQPTAGARPPATLMGQFRQQGSTNALTACAPVRAMLQNRRNRFGRQATQQGLRQDANGVFASSIVSVSAPVVSADGQQALIGSTIASGTLDGAGLLFLLEKQPNGRWQVVAEYQLYVS